MIDSVSKLSGKKRLVYAAPALIVLLLFAVGPVFLDRAFIGLLTKILVFALLAMSVDIVFGYTGMWTFGHAAIFGVAAYTDCILFKQFHITNFWIVAPIGVIMAGITSAIFAAVSIRSSRLYFLLITFALGQLVASAAIQWKPITNGNEGLWGIPMPNVGFPLSYFSYYYFVLFIVLVSSLLLFLFIKSPFGYSLIGIRDNEVRARTMGYNTRLRKFIVFVISGLFAGLAGILYVHNNGGIEPDNVGMVVSGLAIIMVIIGGTGTLWGGILGSVIVILLQYFISLFTPQRWPIYLGAIFIAAVFFARGGIFPRVTNLWKRIIGYGNPES